MLEGVLLGSADNMPKEFNQARCSPKDDTGRPKAFKEWTLAQLIEVAHEVGALRLDVKKFSHELRGFRNYIHPYQQYRSNFSPDQHTAGICVQVLKAAIGQLEESA